MLTGSQQPRGNKLRAEDEAVVSSAGARLKRGFCLGTLGDAGVVPPPFRGESKSSWQLAETTSGCRFTGILTNRS